jgi:hypothetical protein
MEAPIVPAAPAKPQKVQIIGILMIVSGAVNITLALGLMLGFALSVILLCCAPLGALPLALGLLEVIYGIRLVGSGQEPVTERTLQTIAILEIITFVAGNLVSCIIGIVNLVLLNEPDVTAHFRNT